MLKSILAWLGNDGVTVFLTLYIPLWIGFVVYLWKKHPKANKQKELGTSKYASGSHRYSLSVAGVKVVIDAIEESTVHISITGTVDNRPTAVVLNKEDLLTNLTLEERLKKYADALADADLKRSIQG